MTDPAGDVDLGLIASAIFQWAAEIRQALRVTDEADRNRYLQAVADEMELNATALAAVDKGTDERTGD